MTTRLLLRLYDFLQSHRFLRLALLTAVMVAAVASALQLRFKEDISDFLPNDPTYRRSMDLYRQTNVADRIFVVFRMKDTSQVDVDRIVQAVTLFEQQAKAKRWTITARMDYAPCGGFCIPQRAVADERGRLCSHVATDER